MTSLLLGAVDLFKLFYDLDLALTIVLIGKLSISFRISIWWSTDFFKLHTYDPLNFLSVCCYIPVFISSFCYVFIERRFFSHTIHSGQFFHSYKAETKNLALPSNRDNPTPHIVKGTDSSRKSSITNCLISRMCKRTWQVLQKIESLNSLKKDVIDILWWVAF